VGEQAPHGTPWHPPLTMENAMKSTAKLTLISSEEIDSFDNEKTTEMRVPAHLRERITLDNEDALWNAYQGLSPMMR
jgi:hypothetical protein